MADLLEHLVEVRRILKSSGFRAAGDCITDAIAEISSLRAAQVGDVDRAVADRISELDGKLKHERSENARLQAELETARHTITAMAAQINAPA
jgi:hypothetical protein